MKKLFKSILITAALTIATVLYFTSQSNASEFDLTSLALDRLKSQTETGGLVCIRTPSTDNGAESELRITFPTSFSLTTTTSFWTVTTTNLPQGATAWPGIGTATGISGRTVTFPSGNLNANTYYCFRFTDNLTLTTSPTGQKIGQIATYTAGNSQIDFGEYALTVIDDDQISISALVAANPTDFEVDIDQLTLDPLTGTPKEIFNQEEEIEYQVSYGSDLSNPSNITVEAQWEDGEIEDSTSTVEITDYVVASASNAYNSTPPVVDLINKKISWSITSFPADTHDQTVTFKLITNDNYKGSKDVTFSVSARVTGIGTSTPDAQTSAIYQYLRPPAPTPPTSTPGPGPTSTPTPTPTPPPDLNIKYIIIPEIRSNLGKVEVATDIHSNVTLQYGTSPNNLSKQFISSSEKLFHFFTLDNLSPETEYYFRITAEDAFRNREKITSEIYTFKTAKDSDPPLLTQNSVVVTSDNVVLYNATTQKKKSTTVIIPKNRNFEYEFSLDDFTSAKKIVAIVRDRQNIPQDNVLGINNLQQNYAHTDIAQITEIREGVYIGRLRTLPQIGTYTLAAKISDKNGNIVEEKVADLRVVEPLTVQEDSNNNPIENAKITLFIKNETSNLFEKISNHILPINNPTYSDIDGTVPVVLPQGQYRIEVENFGYEPQKIDFSISTDDDAHYPMVKLVKKPFSASDLVNYLKSTIEDVTHLTKDYMQRLSTSIRFFDLLAFTTLSLLITLSLISLIIRTHLSISSIPWYTTYIFHRFIKTDLKQKYIVGKVVNYDTSQPIKLARIYIIDAAKNRILFKGTTNRIGEFIYKKPKSVKQFKISAFKEKYEPSLFITYTAKAASMKDVEIVLKKFEQNDPLKLLTFIPFLLRKTFGFLFELLILTTILFELLFAQYFGLTKTLPYLIASILVLLLWATITAKSIKTKTQNS